MPPVWTSNTYWADASHFLGIYKAGSSQRNVKKLLWQFHYAKTIITDACYFKVVSSRVAFKLSEACFINLLCSSYKNPKEAKLPSVEIFSASDTVFFITGAQDSQISK
ncbi:unnamed protein product [Schistosoma mattheei]|uniref:Uncharacterized protein n=1 Tax=Schistosoma mattheei TaxID=31246 RepID=A0A3P8JLG2_9TREM|nr:unnamed protein product [Schistosoma mattheei]